MCETNLTFGSVGFMAKQEAEKTILASKKLQNYGRKLGVDISSFDEKLRDLVASTSPSDFTVSGIKDR